MAYKRKGKRTYRKKRRTVRKKRSYRKKRSSFTRMYSPRRVLPLQYVTKLKYVQSITMDPTAIAIDQHAFRANGCFDPDAAVGGHQPMNFDLLAAMYRFYNVLGSKITCKFQPTSVTSSDSQMVVGIERQNNASITYATPTTMMEQQDGRWKTTSKDRQTSVTSTFSPFKQQGIKGNSAQTRAAFTVDAPIEYYYNVWCASLNAGVQNPGPVIVQVTILYTVLCTDPLTQPGS